MSKPEPRFEWLFERQRFGVRPGLERTRGLLEALGAPQDDYRVVLIGGTNGKGSTAKVLASCLTAGGIRAGLFTSPHLSRLSERFQVDGIEFPAERLGDALAELRPAAEALDATFFEVLTAAACRLFRQAGVEVAVMEVGLGGRYDATNALTPLLSIITSVSRDHTPLLGEEVSEIARDKAGIMRRGVLCLTAAAGEALTVIREEARCRRTELRVVGREMRLQEWVGGWWGQRFTVSWGGRSLLLRSPLVGRHQLPNLALAAVAAAELGVPDAAIGRGFLQARWPGRLERLWLRDHWVVFDGAHNPAAAAALARELKILQPEGVTLLLGVSADKELEGILQPLRTVARAAVVTQASVSPRALEAWELAARYPTPHCRADPAEAFELARRLSPPGGTMVVAGSLYLVGELRSRLLGEALEPYPRHQ